MQKQTKYDTILWINHAIAYFKSLGKTQKDLALKLGLEESRLSEMKNGSGSISPTLMNNIIDLCGSPRRNSGRFEMLEVYSNLDDFFNIFPSITENRFFRNLIKTFNKKSYIDQICNHCYLIPGIVNENESDDKKREIIISRINELTYSEKFNSIFIEYDENLHSDDCRRNYYSWREQFDLHNGGINGIYINELKIFHGLYLIWLIKKKVKDYYFSDKKSDNIEQIKDLSPIIIIGSRLLIMKNQFRPETDTTINKISKELFGRKRNYTDINGDRCNDWDRMHYIPDDKENYYYPDWWGAVSCELYLSENMNYHLLIHLSPSLFIQYYPDPDIDNEYKANLDINELSDILQKDRGAVITNIDPLDLFQQIETLRKWCDLPKDSHYELKKQIAKAGGYIPGAKILD